jgi:chaperone BCS1
MITEILANPVVTGLSTTAILGSTLYTLKDIPRRVSTFAINQIVTRLTITNQDQDYGWVDNWCSKQNYLLRERNLRLSTNVVGKNVQFCMRTGTNFLFYKGSLVSVEREIDTDKKVQGDVIQQLESIKITMFTRNERKLYQMLSSAYTTQHNTVETRLYNGWWLNANHRHKRSLDTIVLNDGQLERIINDLEWFLESENWYHTRGIPYRRGYLFSGKPGTGKSSIVFAIAAHFNKPINVINIGSVDDDDDLFTAVIKSDPGSIILFEDIDCAMVSNDREKSKSKSAGVTLAGLLNVLDGVLTPEDRIFIMTTNYPDQLDNALIRPGRADVHESIDYLKPAAQVRLSKKFFDGFEPLSYDVSGAELQEAFMKHNDPVLARQYIADKHVARTLQDQLLDSAHPVV